MMRMRIVVVLTLMGAAFVFGYAVRCGMQEGTVVSDDLPASTTQPDPTADTVSIVDVQPGEIIVINQIYVDRKITEWCERHFATTQPGKMPTVPSNQIDLGGSAVNDLIPRDVFDKRKPTTQPEEK